MVDCMVSQWNILYVYADSARGSTLHAESDV